MEWVEASGSSVDIAVAGYASTVCPVPVTHYKTINSEGIENRHNSITQCEQYFSTAMGGITYHEQQAVIFAYSFTDFFNAGS